MGLMLVEVMGVGFEKKTCIAHLEGSETPILAVVH